VSRGRRRPNLRSFVVDNITNYWNPSVTPLTDVLPRGLLDELSVDADEPSKVQSVWGGEYRSGVYSALEGGIWSSTETFQSVRSRGASGGLHQLVVDCLVFLAVGLVDGERVARLL